MMPKISTCDVDGEYSALASEEEEEEDIEELVRRKSSRHTRRNGASTSGGDAGQSLSRPDISPSMTTGTVGPTTTALVLYNYTSSRFKSIKSISDTPVPEPRSEEHAIMTTQGADHTVIIPPCFLDSFKGHAAAPQQYPPKLPWLTEAVDLEWGYVAEPSTQLQTQNEILEADQSISQQSGPQTGNHDVDMGNESATQDKGETKNDDPAGHMTHLVGVFLAFYGVMLGYLGWGPTNSSPRESYPVYFWVSIGMLAYVTFALFGVLRMHKIGGAWTWWAKFLGFTIYPAALIGCAMLIVFVSLH